MFTEVLKKKARNLKQRLTMFNCISENITAIGWWVGVGRGFGGRQPPELKSGACGLD